MDIALSTQMAQQSLLDQVGTAVTAKGLDAQKIEGQNVLQLIASANVIQDAALGQRVNLHV